MACHLLRNGWSTDEVNARLGHTPHSDALDAYINFLALDRDRPKHRMAQNAAMTLQAQVLEARRLASRTGERIEQAQADREALTAALAQAHRDIEVLRQQMQLMRSSGDRSVQVTSVS